MADYAFTTIWRLRAPIERVFDLIDDGRAWPRWWPSVLEVRELEPAGADGLGGRWALTWRGRLPYLLRFETTITRRARPHGMAGAATGELDGTGEWTLHEEPGGWTVARYDWRIRTTRWWMNLLAPLPFVREIFALNHHAVMRIGLERARRELGGVEGRYERLD